MEELFDKAAAVARIRENFENEGDFSFMKEGELEGVIARFVDIDHDYMAKLGDEPYDEDEVYAMLEKAANEMLPDYKMYVMRLCDDYMDFMEQYMVDEGLVEWE
ncbi:MAG: hypothetical protein IKG85_09505 [Clostridia bacterium]|nr:hypothetical protein [Clostridia bacterium]